MKEHGHRILGSRPVDCFLLGAVAVLTCFPYITGLGFYSDDWGVLAAFSALTDHFFGSLFSSHAHHYFGFFRPGQLLYMALLYKVFGLQPLGYHVVNTAVLALGSILFYLTLRELGQGRLIALSVALVFSLLPHFSTTRFWFAASQSNLSLAFYFLSLYSDLRMLKANGSRQWLWKGIGWVSLLGSVVCYETVLPLFLLNPFLVWHRRNQRDVASRIDQEQSSTGLPVAPLTSRRLALLLASNLLVLALPVILKVVYSNRVSDHFDPAHYFLSFFQLVKDACVVSYGVYGIKLPQVLWKIEHEYPNALVALFALILGIAVFLFLRQRPVFGNVRERPDQVSASSTLLKPTAMLFLVGFGMAVFVLGYAIPSAIGIRQTSPTGMINRINGAAAIGAALSFVGFVGLFSSFFRKQEVQRNLFCGLIGLLVVSNIIVNETIASFWVRANKQQQTILQAIYRSFPQLSPGTIVLLDGVCPYDGPAIVFESNYDLWGALASHYHDLTLRADVLASQIKIGTAGVSIFLYNWSNYPYGENVFVYRFDHKMVYPIPNEEAAHHYLEIIRSKWDNFCSPGRPGIGSQIF
jgi:hypothetical protein